MPQEFAAAADITRLAFEAIGPGQEADDDFCLALHIDRIKEQPSSDGSRELLDVLEKDPTVIGFAAEYARLEDAALRHQTWFDVTFKLYCIATVGLFIAAAYLSRLPHDAAAMRDGAVEMPMFVRAAISVVLAYVLAQVFETLAELQSLNKAPKDPRCAPQPGGASLWRSALAKLGYAVVAVVVVVVAPWQWLTSGISKLCERGSEHAPPRQCWWARHVVVAILAASMYAFVVPATLDVAVRSEIDTFIWSGILLSVLYFMLFGAGVFPTRLNKRPARVAWLESRVRAESLRRSLFMAVFNAVKPKEALAPASAPALARALEYFRRFLIEAQLRYFKNKKSANARGADDARRLRRSSAWAFWVLVISLAALLLGGLREQGTSGEAIPPLADGYDLVSSWLIVAAVNGLDEALLILALGQLGSYAVAQLHSLAREQGRNATRFANAYAALRQASSVAPCKLSVECPLKTARVAAAAGDVAAVEAFMQRIISLLAGEVGTWNGATPFVLHKNDDGKPMLISAERLNSEGDFSIIQQQLKYMGFEPRRVRKVGLAAARPATVADLECIACDPGDDQKQKLQPNDWFVVNLDATGRSPVLKDGKRDSYIIDDRKFSDTYEKATGEFEGIEIFRKRAGIDVITALPLPGGYDIVQSWGAREPAASGYLLRNGDDVYGIEANVFDATYIDA